MIFNEHLLFIHVPKTGGTSVTQYLLDVLPKPVYYTHRAHDTRMGGKGIVRIVGWTHETLVQAEPIVRAHGFDLERFPAIVAVIRNPYALEVSLYTYFQSRNLVRAPNQEQIRIARTSDFVGFARRKQRVSLQHFFELDGRIPENMRIVKHERMVEGIKDELRQLGLGLDRELPWRNTSFHLDYTRYYDAATEAVVYDKYRWVFDHGFYERMTPDQFGVVDGAAPPSHLLPVAGPVSEPERRIGAMSGFWPDGWVGEQLTFEIGVERAVAAVQIDGTIPPQIAKRTHLALIVNRRRHRASFAPGQPFSWRVPCRLAAGTTARIEVTASATWCPGDERGAEDRRRLSFHLGRIGFEEAAPDSQGLPDGRRSLLHGVARVLHRTER